MHTFGARKLKDLLRKPYTIERSWWGLVCRKVIAYKVKFRPGKILKGENVGTF